MNAREFMVLMEADRKAAKKLTLTLLELELREKYERVLQTSSCNSCDGPLGPRVDGEHPKFGRV